MSRQVRVSDELILKGDAVMLREYLNRSGGTLARGDVVVLDTTNSTDTELYVTTTTSQDDFNVVGMVYEACAAANGTPVKVQWYGPTDALKVNGTTDIAKGDKLSTYTVAKIGGKASSGSSGVFATALEAYATNDSSGVIDAFLHVGRADSASAGSVTLDGAYDNGGAGAGRAITADTGAVTISNTDADNANILELNYSPSSSASGNALLVTVGANATGNAIDLANAGSGADIDGTASTWSVSKAGAANFASVTASGTITGATLVGTIQDPTIAGNVSQTTSATTGNGLYVNGTTVTTGNVARFEADATNLNGGKIINATVDDASKFSVAEDGAVVIAGTAAAADALTLTAGDLQLTSGYIDVDAGKIEVDCATDLTSYIKRNQGTTTGPVLEIEATAASDDHPALLVDFNGTGAVNAVKIEYDGTAAGLEVAPSNTAGEGIVVTSPANGATQLLKLDGSTGTAAWVGASNVPMLSCATDGAMAAGSALIRGDVTGSLAAAIDGFGILLNDSTAQQATSYAIRIVTTNNEAIHVDSGTCLFDEQITLDGGAVLNDNDALGIGTASAESTLQSNGTNTLWTVASGAIQIGTPGTNYLNISSAGALTLVGTARQTKKFWLPADLFSVRTGSVAKTAVGTAQAMGYAFDAASDEAVSLVWQVPDNWVAGTDATFRVAWTANATANDVIWDVTTVPLAAGEDTTGGGNKDSVTDTCPGTAYLLAYSDATTIGASTEWAAGDLVLINVNRDADAGGDTLAADAFFLGLELNLTIDRI